LAGREPVKDSAPTIKIAAAAPQIRTTAFSVFNCIFISSVAD
jgi:hypothetical protein